jgi:benzodiazapine receptor
MTKNNFWKLVGSIAMCQAAGIVGTLFTLPAIGGPSTGSGQGWYYLLNKPVFAPPNWLFGPVWLTLYTLMGISLYFIWSGGLGRKGARFAFWFFVVHLFVNAGWSIIFFGFHNISLAFAVILLLLAMIIVLIKLFRPINRLASNLLIPYLAWVSIATILNYSLLILNK